MLSRPVLALAVRELLLVGSPLPWGVARRSTCFLGKRRGCSSRRGPAPHARGCAWHVARAPKASKDAADKVEQDYIRGWAQERICLDCGRG